MIAVLVFHSWEARWLILALFLLNFPGAHVNPAVSIAMVILGKLPLKKFPVYVVAQFLGAFVGSCAVFGLYYGEFNLEYVIKQRAKKYHTLCLFFFYNKWFCITFAELKFPLFRCFDGLHWWKTRSYWWKCNSQHFCILPCETSLTAKWVCRPGEIQNTFF